MCTQKNRFTVGVSRRFSGGSGIQLKGPRHVADRDIRWGWANLICFPVSHAYFFVWWGPMSIAKLDGGLAGFPHGFVTGYEFNIPLNKCISVIKTYKWIKKNRPNSIESPLLSKISNFFTIYVLNGKRRRDECESCETDIQNFSYSDKSLFRSEALAHVYHGCKSRGDYRGYSLSKSLSEWAKFCTSPLKKMIK